MLNTQKKYVVLERRPMRLREWCILQRATTALVCKGMSPNLISVLGVASCIIGGVALALTSYTVGLPQRSLFLLAALTVPLRALANLLDGMVAVESGKASPVGELYNEVPERISDIAMLVGLGYAFASTPWLGYVAALIAVLVAYVRVQGRLAGAPQDYAGPMAKPHRMVLFGVATLWMGLMPEKLRSGLWGLDNAWTMPELVLVLIVVGGLYTATRRLWLSSRIVRGTEHT